MKSQGIEVIITNPEENTNVVPNFIAIHPIVVEIFQIRSNWWIE